MMPGKKAKYGNVAGRSSLHRLSFDKVQNTGKYTDKTLDFPTT